MRKLEIDYDFIDKIDESKGKYKLKRYLKRNKFNNLVIASFVTKDIALGAAGVITPEDAVIKVGGYLLTLTPILFLLEKILQKLKEQATGKTEEERADDALKYLTYLLNDLNIDVSVEELKEAVVYHKKYRLRKDGKPGIIRERYIEVPVENTNNDKPISIKEEHVMGSSSYVLTLDTPQRELVYKPVFNM